MIVLEVNTGIFHQNLTCTQENDMLSFRDWWSMWFSAQKWWFLNQNSDFSPKNHGFSSKMLIFTMFCPKSSKKGGFLGIFGDFRLNWLETLQILPKMPNSRIWENTEIVRIFVRVSTALYGQNTAFVPVGWRVRTLFVLSPYKIRIHQNLI